MLTEYPILSYRCHFSTDACVQLLLKPLNVAQICNVARYVGGEWALCLLDVGDGLVAKPQD